MKNFEEKKEDLVTNINLRLRWNAEKIAMLRAALGFSQREFANFIGVPQSYVSNYEKYKFIPEQEVLKKIDSICNEWKDRRVKSLIAEINFIKAF